MKIIYHKKEILCHLIAFPSVSLYSSFLSELQDNQLQKTLSLQEVWRFNSAFNQDKNIFIYDILADDPKSKKHIL